MKKAVIAVAAALIAAVFIPVPKTYADGTKSYSALAYKIVRWNRHYNNNIIYKDTEFYRFPRNLRSVDEIWEGMQICPAEPETADIPGDETQTAEPAVTPTDTSESETPESSAEAETRVTEAAPPSMTGQAPAIKNTDEAKHFIRLYLPYRDGEKYPKVVLIKSASEWKKFYDGLSEYDSDPGLKAPGAKYNEKFFNNKSVVAVLTEEGSGSNSYPDVTVSADGKEITLTRIKPEVRTCDMAYWCVLDELERGHPVFSRNPENIKVKIDDAKFLGQLPGMTVSDVHVGRADGNTLHGLKEEHAASVRKIIGKYSFSSPGYDNISDIIIRLDFEQYYYYDSDGGIITVNGSPSQPISDRAAKLSDSDRIKLNSIIRNYVSTGKTETAEKPKTSGESGAEMSFECKDGKTGLLVIKRSGKPGNSAEEMTVGRVYNLEAKDGPGWTSYENYVRGHYDASYKAPTPVFTMEAYYIPPGGEYTENVDFAGTYGALKPGRYRISKNVTTGTGADCKNKTLYAEFTVKE